MKVLKFGGTSCGTLESIKSVLAIIQKNHQKDQSIAVVFSAMSGFTNQLLAMGRLASEKDSSYLILLKEAEKRHFDIIQALIDVRWQSKSIAAIRAMFNELEDLLKGILLLTEVSARTSDLLVSFGERLSTTMIYEILSSQNFPCEFLDARKVIKTNNHFGMAEVDFTQTNQKIKDYFSKTDKIQLITGFIASTENGITTTLGRGGSDYSGSIFGGALEAEVIEIWTDVNGIMTADPRKVGQAFTVPEISYAEAMELTHFGAKVIYPPSLQPAFAKNIPIKVLNTFNPDFEGTLVSSQVATHKYTITGISSIDDIALVNIMGSGMIGVAGIASKLFTVLARHKVSVILISQASSEHSICFAIEPKTSQQVKKMLENEFSRELENGSIDGIEIRSELSIVAVVGGGMKEHTGVSGRLFSVLGRNGINIVATAQGSSELNISIVIEKYNLSKSLNVIHETFFASQQRTLHLFVLGTGLIASTFLKQLENQESYLSNFKALRVQLAGISNSRKMWTGTPVSLSLSKTDWKNLLDDNGEPAKLALFVEKIKNLNLPNSVFVDCTANREAHHHYLTLFDANISVITANKVANTEKYEEYVKMHRRALEKGVKFMYETNVGAGLPIINTLQGLIASGDRFLKIEAVLSGTVSFIFNTFTKGISFAEVVKEAKQRGYTEPDPREDLSGMDVARKILILAREIGATLELSEVKVEQILPKNCLEAPSIEAFFEELEKSNAYFENLIDKAHEQNKRLRFVATLENGIAEVKLMEVDISHPFYNLSGADNIIAFKTKRYNERVLVIQGPGAGAEVTASGVFADLMSVGSSLV